MGSIARFNLSALIRVWRKVYFDKNFGIADKTCCIKTGCLLGIKRILLYKSLCQEGEEA